MGGTNIKHLGVCALFVLSLMVSLFGVSRLAWSNVRSEINQFHDFLQSHPKVSAELRANPNLVNNKRYLDKHDDLAKFLKHHPDVKRALVNHPSRVFGDYYRGKQAGLSYHR